MLRKGEFRSFLLFASVVAGGVSSQAQAREVSHFYSAELISTSNGEIAHSYFNSLPKKLKEKAFFYRKENGELSVRVFLKKKRALTKAEKELLRESGIEGYRIVKTDPSRVVSRSERVTKLDFHSGNRTKPLKVKSGDGYRCDLFRHPEIVFQVEGHGALEPKVRNVTSSYPGTLQNRRAEVSVKAFAPKVVRKTVSPFGASIKSVPFLKGYLTTYRLNVKELYPVSLKDVKVVLKLPQNSRIVAGTPLINGKPVVPQRKGELLFIPVGSLKPNGSFTLEIRFTSPEKSEKIKSAILARTENGSTLTFSKDGDFVKELSGKTEFQRISKQIKGKKAHKIGASILFPSSDVVVPQPVTEIYVSVPIRSKYLILLNGKEIPKKFRAEKGVDRARQIILLKYYGVPLKEGINDLRLVINGEVVEERKITVSSDISDFKFKVFPKKPVADGRSYAYVVVEAYDKNGNPAKENTYITVTVDKGDIFDYSTGRFEEFQDHPLRVQLVNGRAVLKLSPAKSIEERKITVTYGGISRDFTLQFYPEKRPWIVVGELEGDLGVSSTHNSPSKMEDMPFDHSKSGTHVRGRGAVFAKGSLKDFVVTLRYDTKRPDDVLLQQNTPSTEEGEFYPVYGDDSEQYFEAKSKRHLFLRVEKGLSYGLFGDFRTDFGEELDYNRYNRTFNGILLNLEKRKNYRIRAFVTKNDQDIVREEFKGRGTSGPFFLKGSVEPFSEKVWIEIRDRYNPQVVLERRELNRFTDYEINYTEGFIVLKEPLPEFDENLNPEYLIVRYETKSLPKEEYFYGLRAEKWIKGVRFGLFSVKEEHPVRDRKLLGADFYYNRGPVKVLGEYARSLGFERDNLAPTSGKAYRLEAGYNLSGTSCKLFFKKVTGGFQNPSSDTVEESYRTYGYQFSKDWKRFKLSSSGTVESRSGTDRKEADLRGTYLFTEKLSLGAGLRWNREEREDATDSYLQGIGELHWNVTDKLSLSLRREQSFSGRNNSTYYPNRTVGKVSYRLNPNLTAYLQSEYRELEDRDESLTTFGLNSKLDKNTTAYSKYTLDDSASGWRVQSHLGLNRTFKFSDKLSFDLGGENVHTYRGEGSSDYTALRFRGTYRQSEKYLLSGDYEIRFGNVKTEHLLRAGGIFKVGKDYTLFLRDRFFISSYKEHDLLFGLARRPMFNDKLNWLLKLRLKLSDKDEVTKKAILSTHINYQPTSRLTFMGEYALKYEDVESVGTSLTDLLRGRVTYDLTDRFDVNFHAGIMRNVNTSSYLLSWGPEVGVRVVKNFWVSVGYNFSGFYDRDFEDANYWAKGFYMKFRVKFDENTFKKLDRLLSRRTRYAD